jgi:hypothetical protein
MKHILQLAGTLQLLLALAHFDFVRRFEWRADLERVSLFTRQVFWVHLWFLVLVLAGFGVLSLGWTKELLRPEPLAKAVLGGIGLFWAARLAAQFCVYDSALWRGSRARTLGHWGFSLLWAFLAAVYLLAAIRR